MTDINDKPRPESRVYAKQYAEFITVTCLEWKPVLQDDRHLLRVAGLEMARDRHAGMVGAEGDVEVMAAGQALLGDHRERVLDHAPQRALDELAVVEGAGRRAGADGRNLEAAAGGTRPAPQGKLGGFCCPVPPGPRLPNQVRQREPYGYRWHL